MILILIYFIQKTQQDQINIIEKSTDYKHDQIAEFYLTYIVINVVVVFCLLLDKYNLFCLSSNFTQPVKSTTSNSKNCTRSCILMRAVMKHTWAKSSRRSMITWVGRLASPNSSLLFRFQVAILEIKWPDNKIARIYSLNLGSWIWMTVISIETGGSSAF